MGLVEVGVGLIPAGGGCLRMVERFTEPIQGVESADLLAASSAKASLTIAMAKVAPAPTKPSNSAFCGQTDGISLEPRRASCITAKWRALGLARAGYRPPRPGCTAPPATTPAATIGARIWGMVEGGFASPHDALIANKLAHILCGGFVAAGTEVGDQHYLDLECRSVPLALRRAKVARPHRSHADEQQAAEELADATHSPSNEQRQEERYVPSIERRHREQCSNGGGARREGHAAQHPPR